MNRYNPRKTTMEMNIPTTASLIFKPFWETAIAKSAGIVSAVVRVCTPSIKPIRTKKEVLNNVEDWNCLNFKDMKIRAANPAKFKE
jgi:hypothetical protein